MILQSKGLLFYIDLMMVVLRLHKHSRLYNQLWCLAQQHFKNSFNENIDTYHPRWLNTHFDGSSTAASLKLGVVALLLLLVVAEDAYPLTKNKLYLLHTDWVWFVGVVWVTTPLQFDANLDCAFCNMPTDCCC